jgi:uncharacterized damage-inducible protein DinB
MSDIATFRETYEREHERTRKVLAAFPADQLDFKPHEKSNSARQLAWLFVGEEMLMLKALLSQPVLGSGMPKGADSLQAVLEAFDTQHALMMDALRTADAAALAPVKFPAGPGQMKDWPAMEFLWFMLFDQIHHRGQMSVYSRMAGGKVPAIYGPSADERWF